MFYCRHAHVLVCCRSNMGRHMLQCNQGGVCTASLANIWLFGVFVVFVFLYFSYQLETVYLKHFKFKKQPIENSNYYKFGKHPSTAWNRSKIVHDGICTIDSLGRLGNQMGEYAALYALAKHHGHQAFIPSRMFSLLAPLFPITLPMLPESVEREIPWRIYPLNLCMDDDYKHIKGKFIKFTGYPMSYTYFNHIRDEITKEFTFHDFIREEAYGYLAKLKGSRKNATFIGVHVRRGDYAEYMTRRWQGVIAGKDYVDKAMLYFRNKYLEPVFVVVSNDMKWCKENIDASKEDVYFSGDGIEYLPEKDFALLSHCNHSIMTLGTFGTWSSYLAGGETIYLTNFSLPDSGGPAFPYDKMYPPEWTGIPADLSSILQQSN